MKNKIWFWVLVVLILINVAALVTILYQRNNQPVPAPPAPVNDIEFRGMNYFLRHELNLDDKQFTSFRKLRKASMEESRQIMWQLHEKRNVMLQELAAPDPDTKKLKSISRDIGKLHEALKLETVHHFLELKALCTPEQEKKLNQFMLEIKDRNPRPWHDKPRHRHGHRNRLNRNMD